MNSKMGFSSKLGSLTAPVCVMIRGVLAIRRISRLQTCMRSVRLDPDHDAVMRIGGKAPGGGPILFVGIGAMSAIGFPPPRIIHRQFALTARARAE